MTSKEGLQKDVSANIQDEPQTSPEDAAKASQSIEKAEPSPKKDDGGTSSIEGDAALPKNAPKQAEILMV